MPPRSSPSRIASLGAACVALVALVAGGACEPPPAEPPPPPMVETATPETRAVVEYLRYTGTLEPVAAVDVRARVSGVLTEVAFDESSDVEAGAILFRIEREPYEIAVGRAEAAVARARAALDLAAARLARTEEAFDAEAANEIELIENRAARDRAVAELMSAEQDLAAARLDLSYTEVRSPIAGRIDRPRVDRGNLVGREGPTLLARVVALDPMRVGFDVSETIALRYLASGRNGVVDDSTPRVEVGLADETGYPHVGRLDFVDNQLDPDTGTLRVRAVLPNDSGKLYPGLFARIRVPFEERENAILVREQAIGRGLEGAYVLVVGDDDTVSRRPVVLGAPQDDGTIVVLEGLRADATYVVAGLQKARPGATVRTRPWSEADAPGGERRRDGATDADDEAAAAADDAR